MVAAILENMPGLVPSNSYTVHTHTHTQFHQHNKLDVTIFRLQVTELRLEID